MTKILSRFSASLGAVGTCLLLAASAYGQQGYPSKPIRFIVPYTPGGSVSTVARLIGERLSVSLGTPVVIENHGGANTQIGTDMVAKARPDGYTILSTVSSHVLIPLLFPSPFDPIKDFAPVAAFGSTEMMLVTYPGLPVNNLRELIALAKSKQGGLNYATGGAGSATNLAGELFNKMVGVQIRHIAYKGGSPALIDVAGGQVEMSFVLPSSAMPLIKGGRLKPIAVTGEKRLAALPDVPTFTEAGLPGFDMKQWYGVLAPANTPKEIVNKLAGEISKIASTDDFKAQLALQGIDSYVVPSEKLGDIMRAENVKFLKIISEANIKVDR